MSKTSALQVWICSAQLEQRFWRFESTRRLGKDNHNEGYYDNQSDAEQQVNACTEHVWEIHLISKTTKFGSTFAPSLFTCAWRIGVLFTLRFWYSTRLAIWVSSLETWRDSVRKAAGQHSWGLWSPPGDICSSEAKGGYPTLPPGHWWDLQGTRKLRILKTKWVMGWDAVRRMLS